MYMSYINRGIHPSLSMNPSQSSQSANGAPEGHLQKLFRGDQWRTRQNLTATIFPSHRWSYIYIYTVFSTYIYIYKVWNQRDVSSPWVPLLSVTEVGLVLPPVSFPSQWCHLLCAGSWHWIWCVAELARASPHYTLQSVKSSICSPFLCMCLWKLICLSLFWFWTQRFRFARSSKITPSQRRQARRARPRARTAVFLHKKGLCRLSPAKISRTLQILNNHHSRDVEFLRPIVNTMAEKQPWRCKWCILRCGKCDYQWHICVDCTFCSRGVGNNHNGTTTLGKKRPLLLLAERPNHPRTREVSRPRARTKNPHKNLLQYENWIHLGTARLFSDDAQRSDRECNFGCEVTGRTEIEPSGCSTGEAGIREFSRLWTKPQQSLPRPKPCTVLLRS